MYKPTVKHKIINEHLNFVPNYLRTTFCSVNMNSTTCLINKTK